MRGRYVGAQVLLDPRGAVEALAKRFGEADACTWARQVVAIADEETSGVTPLLVDASIASGARISFADVRDYEDAMTA